MEFGAASEVAPVDDQGVHDIHSARRQFVVGVPKRLTKLAPLNSILASDFALTSAIKRTDGSYSAVRSGRPAGAKL